MKAEGLYERPKEIPHRTCEDSTEVSETCEPLCRPPAGVKTSSTMPPPPEEISRQTRGGGSIDRSAGLPPRWSPVASAFAAVVKRRRVVRMSDGGTVSNRHHCDEFVDRGSTGSGYSGTTQCVPQRLCARTCRVLSYRYKISSPPPRSHMNHLHALRALILLHAMTANSTTIPTRPTSAAATARRTMS